MTQTVSDSQFYMWRTLFALAHVDNVITSEEREFMEEALADIPFSNEQHAILKEDIESPEDPVKMYNRIGDPVDQTNFFNFAQELVWVDGDYGAEEQEIMIKLQKISIQNTNVDDLVGKAAFELEEDIPSDGKGKDPKSMVFSFRRHFLRSLGLAD